MVEPEVTQEPVAVWLPESDWRFVAACVAAQVISTSDVDEERRLARLWTVLHPEGEV